MTDRERQRYEEAKKIYDALMKFYPFTLDNLDGEHWERIPDYEGYLVSNYGRVKSFKFKTPRILKPALNTQGYLFVDLSSNNKQKKFRINRLVAMIFIPNPDNKPEVNHINGNKIDNRVENLEWVTCAENMAHAVTNGLQKSGADVYNAKFTNEQIEYIRNNTDKLTVSRLAKIFDTTTTIISRIQTGKTYRKAGGNIRQSIVRKKPKFLNDIEKAEIRRLYIKGSTKFGSVALGRKYGVDNKTVWEIVTKEGD